LRVCGVLQISRSSASSWKKSGELAEEGFHELLGGHRGSVGMPVGGDHHVLDGALLAIGELHFDLRGLGAALF
jgi:hypothetical protein